MPVRFMDLPMLTFIDLFAGCGGVTAGYKAAGFSVHAAVEWNAAAAQTYRLNHPEVRLIEQDIRTVDPADLHPVPGTYLVLGASAPCQPFSSVNKYRPLDADPRASLFLEPLRFIQKLQPHMIFIENVPLVRKSEVFRIFCAELDALGYRYIYTVCNAADYGVPQHRKRLFVLGTRCPWVTLRFPEPTHAHPSVASSTGKLPWTSVADVFAGLPVVHAGESCMDDPLHRSPVHHARVLERIRHVPKNGGSRDALPLDLLSACHRTASGFAGSYGRLHLDKPAGTITTHFRNACSGRFIHPTLDRVITPREAARLQTFPDTYRFAGTFISVVEQIGNAVPVVLATAIARSIRDALLVDNLAPYRLL
jgi:DNA (cytosine-5)-methyltransferase 1